MGSFFDFPSAAPLLHSTWDLGCSAAGCAPVTSHFQFLCLAGLWLPAVLHQTWVSPPSLRRLFAVIVSMFEKRLKELNPSLPTISYDIADLYSYLDTFHDFSALVYGDPFPTLSCLC